MDPFIGTIIMFAGNFAPRGWAFCDGQLLDVASNATLFSILGVTYGGDGRTTFALPDLRGRVPLHPGQGPGLQPYQLGEHGGTESVTLNPFQMPGHDHPVRCTSQIGDQDSPVGAIPAAEQAQRTSVWSKAASDGSMAGAMIGENGGNQAHENRQPFTSVNFIIALQGTYPPRS